MGVVSNMGYCDENGDFPKSKMAFASDALATLFGSFFGLSPTTSFIESAAGVGAGSRTGFTACLCGVFFLLSIFFAPVIASIPPWATGGSLIVVGALMAKSLKNVKWHDPAHAATAFLTVMMMPLTYSIAYGLIAGIGCWIACSLAFKFLSLVGMERPEFEEEEEIVHKHKQTEAAEPEASAEEEGKPDSDQTPEEDKDVQEA